MLSNNLAADVEMIQTFCKQNSIAIFYGVPENSACAPCRWNKAVPAALSGFLAALQTAEARILHLNLTYNELSLTEVQAIRKAIAALPKPKQKAFTTFLQRLQKDNGAPLTLVATFLHEGVQYAFLSHSPLSNHYNTVTSLIGDDGKEQEESPVGQPKNPVLFSDYIAARKASAKTIADLARKIADDPQHIHAKTQTKRRELAEERAKEAGIRLSTDRIDVAKKAEEIFIKEKLAVREQERNQRVAAAQKKNKNNEQKLSKRDIADMLNIPEREMYKYFKK